MHIDLEFFKYLDCNSFFKKEYIIYRNIFRKGFDYRFFMSVIFIYTAYVLLVFHEKTVFIFQSLTK